MAAAGSKIQKREKQCLKRAEQFRHTGAVCVYLRVGTINVSMFFVHSYECYEGKNESLCLPFFLSIRHDWFYYTSTKCAIPDDMAGQQRF